MGFLGKFRAIRLRGAFAATGLIVLAVLASAHPASAVAQGYATKDQGLRAGMVAGLSNDSSSGQPLVERASQGKEERIVGVVTTPGNELVTLASGTNNIYVQTAGEVVAFVSDVNGNIKKGDMLTMSPLRGILMKAEDSSAAIVGIALEDLDIDTAEKVTVNGSDQGKVPVGQISINLASGISSSGVEERSNTTLSALGRTLVGRDVADLRVVAALIIFLIVLVVEGGIIYGAISSSIIALGRNPMAHRIIVREIFKVAAIALTVLILGVLAIYGVLWV